jgi:UDP-N-acetyl-D-mannosaminuronic acid transferase (WecB/TagA/CpsF family)
MALCISTKIIACRNGYIINTKLNIILTICSENSAVNSVITQVTPQGVGLVYEHNQFIQWWFH